MPGLVFHDTTSAKAGLIEDCEFNLNFPYGAISGDSTTLLPTLTRLINVWYQKIVTMIFASQDDWTWDDSNATDYPIAITNLVANQQDYSIPVSLNMLRIQTVNVSYDGGTTWRRANPFNKNESYQPLDTTNLKNNYTIVNPFYSIENNAIFVYPVPTANSTGGLKIWFQRGPLEFATSDTTKAPGIDPGFHRMISLGACYEFAVIKNLPTKDYFKNSLDDYEIRLKQYYGRKDDDRSWVINSIYKDDYGS
jgi:hypothetical protein